MFLPDKEVDNCKVYTCSCAANFFFIFSWCNEISFDVIGRDRSNFVRRLDSVEIIIVGRIDRSIVNGVISNLEVVVVIRLITFFLFFFFE